MGITPVVLRNLVNAPATPAYPATGYTLHAEDLNAIRKAISIGTESIYTKGILLGSDGIEIQTTTPFLMDDGSSVQFKDGGAEDAVVGSLTHDGELSMRMFTVMEGLTFQADAWIRFQGDSAIYLPEQAQTNLVVYRGAADVLDLDVFYDTEVHALHFLFGTYVANKAGEGYAMRNASKVSRLRLRDDDVLVIEDADDMSARPVTWSNEREIPTGVPGSTPIQEIVGTDGVYAIEVTASPRTYQVGLEVAGVESQHLDIGPGAAQVNVDNLWAAGGGSGAAATLVTPAQRQAIDDLLVDMAAAEVAISERVKYLRMPDGTLVAPNASGYIQFIDSGSALWDSPAANTVRVIASGGGGGGGGGGVATVTAGAGLGNTGSSSNPILDVKLADGLVFVGDEVGADFGGTGVATTVARSDHDHAGVYSLVGHAHAGVYIATGGAYADLVAAAKIGTGAAQVAAGNDARFHTQNTDTNTTSMIFMLRSAFAGIPAGGDISGIAVNRGASTDARIYYQETTSKWVAGLVGSEQPIILDGDARLGDARAPLSHDLDADHVGSLPASRVEPVYAPGNYTPTGITLDGYLEGIDTALGAVVSAPGLGQTLHVCVDVGTAVAGQYLLGSGVVGVRAKGAGTFQSYSMNTQLPMDPLTTIELKVENHTQATSAVVSLGPGDLLATGDLGLAVDDGDIIAIKINSLSGAPAAGMLNFTLVKEE